MLVDLKSIGQFEFKRKDETPFPLEFTDYDLEKCRVEQGIYWSNIPFVFSWQYTKDKPVDIQHGQPANFDYYGVADDILQIKEFANKMIIDKVNRYVIILHKLDRFISYGVYIGNLTESDYKQSFICFEIFKLQ